ncbi:hypothetical protein [Rubidibacter lacunae]|nr:hypothetical protein [Rubidibacter lacunae]
MNDKLRAFGGWKALSRNVIKKNTILQEGYSFYSDISILAEMNIDESYAFISRPLFGIDSLLIIGEKLGDNYDFDDILQLWLKEYKDKISISANKEHNLCTHIEKCMLKGQIGCLPAINTENKKSLFLISQENQKLEYIYDKMIRLENAQKLSSKQVLAYFHNGAAVNLLS